MKAKASSRSLKRSINELKRVSARIEAKMAKLENMIAGISEDHN